MNMPIPRRAVLALLAVLPFVGCNRGRAGAGKAVRVVSISPSTTEAMFAIGAGHLLVGRSRYCDHPKEAERLPVVGGFADPSLEAILALSPTLVVGARGPAGPALESALRESGIETYFPETESLDGITRMITELGRRVGHAEGAFGVVASIEDRKKAVAVAIAGRPRPRVLFLFDVSPISVAGPGSFPDEMLRLAGADNVITRGGAYPTLNLEHLLALDPDVILDGASDVHAGRTLAQMLEGVAGWRDLRAMREGRIRAVGSDALRPGPRIGEGLVTVARAVHGDDLPLTAPGKP